MKRARTLRAMWGFLLSVAGFAAGAGDERFLGGSRDGHASAYLYVVPEIIHIRRYCGGSRDGASSDFVIQTPAQLHQAQYMGGSRDGSAADVVCGLPHPLDRDSDSDGMPDWWELDHFGWITSADPQDDSDVDGVAALSEYVADTDPNNPGSFFHVISFLLDAAWNLTFTCSPARVYTVQATENIATGVWQHVEGLVLLPGEADGEMTLSDTNIASRAFYRVVVGFPP